MTLKEKENLISQFIVFLNNIPSDNEAQIPVATNVERVELLTVKECAEEVNGLSEHTVRQLVAQGKLAHIRSGAGKRGKILIPKAALLEYFGGQHEHI